MTLTAAQISDNYEKTYQLTADILTQKFKARGYESDPASQDFIDLCQSVIGHETSVLLLQQESFEKTLYQPILETVIDEVKRTFFPDTSKKRFLSIDALDRDILPAEMEEAAADNEALPETLPIDFYEEILTPEAFQYLTEKLLPKYEDWQTGLRLFARAAENDTDSNRYDLLEDKISLLRDFYPNGNIAYTHEVDGLSKLDKDQVIQTFINVYIGMERSFPVNFLQKDGENRCRLMIRFLIEEILKTEPETVLNTKDETFFIRHRLQNVYRYFNYSTNRALRNAYPEMIPPWLHSRCSANYWEDAGNRVEAIRWLFEERLNMTPDSFYRQSISKSVFAKHGLSYMFNQYYNSVSKALGEAYPHLRPWEIGKVPFDFWTTETTAEAIRWMVAKKGWEAAELPAKVRSKELNRKTFSEFGLATLFEKKFSKSIYRAISAAWPERFEPWELGKVASEYWESNDNIYQASVWIAEKEGLQKHEIPPAIREKRLTAKSFSKYSIGAALKKLAKGRLERLFSPLFWQEHKTFLEEHKLMRKIANLKKSEKKSNLFEFFLYGLFMPEVQRSSHDRVRRYRRMERRIQQRSIIYKDQ